MIFWLPSLVFLLVAGLGLFGVMTWTTRYSPQAKAKRRRLRDLEVGFDGTPQSRAREHRLAWGAFDRWLRSHIAIYTQLDELLIRANSALSALQVVGICPLAGVLGGFAMAVLGGGWVAILLLSATTTLAPILWLLQRAQSRRTAFESRLPEALDFLTRSLRAGHSITVSFGVAANELSDPIGSEFKIVFDEIGFGIPFEESLTAMARRIASPDLHFMVVALLIQRETGGNLTELLDGLAKTVRERIKLKGKVRTLSAEGRFSAVLLGSLPFVLGGILTLLNPAYMSALWDTPQGQQILRIGAVLLAVGFIALSRVTKIKV